MKSLFTLALFLAFYITTVAQDIIFVDSSNTGTQDGQSWSTAYTSIQQAIDLASLGDTIFVAKGTYYPSVGLAGSADPRDKSFLIPSGICLFGGFVGNESVLSDRSIDSTTLHITNKTLLSGDIGTANDVSDNSYHVIVSVLSSNSTTFDGFTISHGNADGLDSIEVNGIHIYRNYGGGISLANSDLNLKNCVIRDNTSSRGGGGLNNYESDPNIEANTFYMNSVVWNNDQDPMSGGGAIRNDASDPSIYLTTFSNNDCYSAQGGGAIRNVNASNPIINDSRIRSNTTTFGGDGGAGIYNALESAPTISNSRFIANYTPEQGGAIYNDNSLPVISNCLFQYNIGNGGAGAIESDGGSHMSLTNCKFISNTTDQDGGALQNWKSSPQISDCLFDGNQADGDGGAIFNYTQCNPWIENSIFRNNSCYGNGGAIYNRRDCSPIITQVLIYDNYAGIDGGGVYTVTSNSAPCSPIATNVTIVHNEAGNSGGGAFDDGLGDSRLKNSIVLGNSAPNNNEIDAPAASATTNVFYCIIGDEYYTFGSNLPTTYSGDVFVDPTNDDFHLATNSPGINTGDSSVFSTSAIPDISHIEHDFDGKSRLIGSNVDLGVYETCEGNLESYETAERCHEFYWTIIDSTFRESVFYTDTVQTNHGCDSIIHLTLTLSDIDAGVIHDLHFSLAAIPSGATSYQWLNCDQGMAPIYNQTQELFSPENSGNYAVIVGIDSCTDTSECRYISLIGINGIENPNNLKVYPNPSTANQITIEGEINSGTDIKILDISGRLVITAIAEGHKTRVDVSGLKAGTYVISVTSLDELIQTKRLVITR